jgi:signal transduction histidine kinase
MSVSIRLLEVSDTEAREAHDWPAAAGLLALAWTEAAFGPVTSPRWQQALLAAAWTLPLAWRRRRPVAVLAGVALAGTVLLEVVNSEGGLISYVLAAVLAAFTVGRHASGQAAWWGPGLAVGWWWVYYAATGGVLSDYEFTALIYGGAFAVGFVLRHRAGRIEHLTGVVQELNIGVAERERQAVEHERARIARELHDIVSHSISAGVIHTQAVRRRLDTGQHQREIDDLRAVETTLRHAMAEMRRLLGMLRADGQADALAPQPGLAQLSGLVADMHAAGIDVAVGVHGDPVLLSPGVDLAAYRIIQEALTNVMKHATSARATVGIHYQGDQLSLCVENAASPTQSVATDQGGQGLIGMRERVSLYGGTLKTGAHPAGGFTVEATLPLRADEGS